MEKQSRIQRPCQVVTGGVVVSHLWWKGEAHHAHENPREPTTAQPPAGSVQTPGAVSLVRRSPLKLKAFEHMDVKRTSNLRTSLLFQSMGKE